MLRYIDWNFGAQGYFSNMVTFIYLFASIQNMNIGWYFV